METENAPRGESVSSCGEVFVDEFLDSICCYQWVFRRFAPSDGLADGFLDIDDADLTHGVRLKDNF